MAFTLGQSIALTTDLDADGVIDPGETVGVTLTLGTGTTGGTGIQLTINLTGLTYVAGSLNISPLALDDAFTPFGNTPFTGSSLFANDFEFFGDTFGFQNATGVGLATAQGGTITLNANGTFSYLSAAGFTGTDTFTYTITDPGGLTGQATVSFNVGPAIWYIDDSVAGGPGNGTRDNPFRSIAEFNAANTGGAGKPEAGDLIYLRFGDDGTYSSADGINLLANQQLIGQGENLTVTHPSGGAPVTLETGSVGQTPTISVTGASQNGVDLASGNTLKGFNVATTLGSQTGINDGGVNVGTLTVSNVDVTGAGKAVDIDQGGALNVTVDLLNSTASTTEGVDLGGGVSGTFNVASASSAISGSTGVAFNVGSGTASIDYNGSVTKTSDGRAIVVNGHTAGVVRFDGAVSSTGAADGVNLTGNTSATVTFGGGLTIAANSGGGAAFNATGGGFIGVTGSTNSINATGVSAVNVDGTTIGAAGLTFLSVSSQGGSDTGIILNNAGAGGFTVTGTGSTAGSGGTIANKSGSDGAVLTGVGVYLSNTDNISFSNMTFSGTFGNFGIRGLDVVNFTLRDSTMSGQFGSSNAANEAAVSFGTQSDTLNGLTGVGLFEGNNISGGYEDNLHIFNNAAGTLDLTIRDSANDQAVFGSQGVDLGGGVHSGNDSVTVETTSNSVLNLLVEGVSFTAFRGDALQTIIGGSATHNLTVRNNTFHNAHVNTVSGGGSVTIGGGSLGSNYTANYNITGNSFRGAEGTALNVSFIGSAGTIVGLIKNNVIGVDDNVVSSAQATTGSRGGGEGIMVSLEKFAGTGVLTYSVRIDGNQVRDIVSGFSGIYLRSNTQDSGGTGRLEATVTNNVVEEMGNNALTGLYAIVGGASGTTDFGRMGLDISGNAFNMAGSANGSNAVLFDQVSTNARFYFPGYAGGANGELRSPPGTASANLGTYLAGRGNTMTNAAFPGFASGPVDATLVVGAAGGTFVLTPPPLSVLLPELAAVGPTSSADPDDATLPPEPQVLPAEPDGPVLLAPQPAVPTIDVAAIERAILAALAAGDLQNFAIPNLPANRTLSIVFRGVADAQVDKFLSPASVMSTVISNNPTVSDTDAVPLDSLTLSGFVWGDTDRDGVVDGGEVGVSGVTVELYADTDDSGGFSAGDVLLSTIVTGAVVAGANYSFTNLASGDYFVRLTSGRGAFPLSGAGELDPDNNADSDDNGFVDNGVVLSRTITLAYNTEPTNGVGNDANATLDFALAPGGTAGVDVLLGESGRDSIDGGASGDTINGAGGDDTLNGAGGNDTLIGGLGNDSLVGGAGDDRFEVDAAGDVVVEVAGEGTADVIVATASYTIAAHVEALRIVGTGLTGTGSAGVDLLVSAGGANTLIGLGGDDVYVVNTVGDIVTEAPAAGYDVVVATVSYTLPANTELLVLRGTGLTGTGTAGADAFRGETGPNTFVGLGGDDTYVLGNAGDTVTEAAGGGIDSVFSTFSHTLGVEVEQLFLTGAGLTGTGNAGSNLLSSAGGANTLVGLAGDDVYLVNTAGDVVTEAAGEGYDLMVARVSRTIAANVEGLIVVGTGLTATGGGSGDLLVSEGNGNTLTGGGGDDFLLAGAKSDALTGGLGGDAFAFRSLNGVVLADRFTITDFDAATGDGVDLSRIDAIAGGADDAFTIGALANGQAGRLQIDQVSPTLYRLSGDVDGDGVADFMLDVTLAGGGTWNPGNIFL